MIKFVVTVKKALTTAPLEMAICAQDLKDSKFLHFEKKDGEKTILI